MNSRVSGSDRLPHPGARLPQPGRLLSKLTRMRTKINIWRELFNNQIGQLTVGIGLEIEIIAVATLTATTAPIGRECQLWATFNPSVVEGGKNEKH